jgi:hypothetical protein
MTKLVKDQSFPGKRTFSHKIFYGLNFMTNIFQVDLEPANADFWDIGFKSSELRLEK